MISSTAGTRKSSNDFEGPPKICAKISMTRKKGMYEAATSLRNTMVVSFAQKFSISSQMRSIGRTCVSACWALTVAAAVAVAATAGVAVVAGVAVAAAAVAAAAGVAVAAAAGVAVVVAGVAISVVVAEAAAGIVEAGDFSDAEVCTDTKSCRSGTGVLPVFCPGAPLRLLVMVDSSSRNEASIQGNDIYVNITVW